MDTRKITRQGENKLMNEKNKEASFWDVRLIQKKIRSGEVTEKEYGSYLSSLADSADKAISALPVEEEPENFISTESEILDSSAQV